MLKIEIPADLAGGSSAAEVSSTQVFKDMEKMMDEDGVKTQVQ